MSSTNWIFVAEREMHGQQAYFFRFVFLKGSFPFSFHSVQIITFLSCMNPVH